MINLTLLILTALLVATKPIAEDQGIMDEVMPKKKSECSMDSDILDTVIDVVEYMFEIEKIKNKMRTNVLQTLYKSEVV